MRCTAVFETRFHGGVLKLCSTTPRPHQGSAAVRRRRLGAKASAVNSSAKEWTRRCAWTTLARCQHAPRRSNDVRLDQFRRSERPRIQLSTRANLLSPLFASPADENLATGEDPLHFLSSTISLRHGHGALWPAVLTRGGRGTVAAQATEGTVTRLTARYVAEQRSNIKTKTEASTLCRITSASLQDRESGHRGS
jgi:hypothetical protein